MNCRYCGTPLQPGALFCVECGRSVGAEEPVATPVPRGVPVAQRPPVPHCPQCGSAIEEADIFCGECGFVLRPVTAELGMPVRDPEPEPEPELVPEPEEVPLPRTDLLGGAPLEDIESTRIVARPPAGERYVLQFSTGESIVVSGTGLIGRNPAAEPGEYVDELVTVFDVGKSVSKSHIEFGQESGRFWVSDRYSTNGTIIRQPDAAPIRCEPGKRYLISRGSRVEIGEQFFVVS